MKIKSFLSINNYAELLLLLFILTRQQINNLIKAHSLEYIYSYEKSILQSPTLYKNYENIVLSEKPTWLNYIPSFI